jgi:hypothetical protein
LCNLLVPQKTPRQPSGAVRPHYPAPAALAMTHTLLYLTGAAVPSSPNPLLHKR